MKEKKKELTVVWRDRPEAADCQVVRRICSSTGFFRPDEVDVAEELVQEALNRGTESGYHFLFAELDGRTAGYACFGPIPCSVTGWDLYWIVVDNDMRFMGLGRLIADEAIRRIASAGGLRVYAETSSTDIYLPTRRFYEKNGFYQEAALQDFYAPGDSKVIYVRVVSG